MEKTETKDSHTDGISFLEGVGIETKEKASAYMVTFTPYFRNVARREITDFDSTIKFERPISDSIALVTSGKPKEHFIKMPVFHMYRFSIFG